MRTFLLGLLIASILTPVVHGDCIPREQLVGYLTKNFDAKPRQVLALDHKTRKWTGHLWDGKGNLTDPAAGFEELALAKPRVLIGTAPLLVVVTNTNPFLYTARQTAATRVDSADLAALQQLALSLGGVISFAANAAGQREALSGLRAATERAGNISGEAAMQNLQAQPSIAAGDIEELAAAFVTALHGKGEKREEKDEGTDQDSYFTLSESIRALKDM